MGHGVSVAGSPSRAQESEPMKRLLSTSGLRLSNAM